MASLARRAAWQKLIDNYDERIASTRLECQYLSARARAGDADGLAKAVEQRWLTGHQLPIECEPAFQWLRDTGVLDEALTEKRLELLLENGETGFARAVARRLPDARAAPYLQWARLLQNPIAEFDALIAQPQRAALPAALASAWTRFTRANPEAAMERFELLLATRGIEGEEASSYARQLALGLAWDRLGAEAIDTFRQVARMDLDDYALEWLARAALWVDDWRLASDAIAAMSDARRDTSAWQYWSARTARKLENEESAQQSFAAVVANDNYYSALAAAHLDTLLQPQITQLPRDAEVLSALARRPGLERARELFAVGLTTEATREWRRETAELSDIERAQSVHLAASWGWYDVGVAMATRNGVFNDYELLYPRPYDEEVREASGLAALPETLLYGLVRQESLYRIDAVSSSGAIGLTQLLPETARRTAELWEQQIPSRRDLFEPQVNIRLGAAQLKTLADQFEDQLIVALAAYNAGPNAARRWLPERPMEADVWVENVPYNETRAFVRRVLWHSLVFAWLQDREGQNTNAWLMTVNPLTGD